MNFPKKMELHLMKLMTSRKNIQREVYGEAEDLVNILEISNTVPANLPDPDPPPDHIKKDFSASNE